MKLHNLQVGPGNLSVVKGTTRFALNATTGEATFTGKISGPAPATGLYTLRARVTASEVNSGQLLFDVPDGLSVRIVTCKLIAVGGNASGATAVVVGTGANSLTTSLFSYTVSALTRSKVVPETDSNCTVLTDGASHAAQTAGHNVYIGKTGSDLSGATHIDVILEFTLE